MTLDAVSVEHQFADLLGISGRGGPSDADAVRSGNPRYLAEALSKALPRLKKRADKLPTSDGMHVWVEKAIRDADGMRERLEKGGSEIDKSGCFLLWVTCANLLNFVSMYLGQKGL